MQPSIVSVLTGWIRSPDGHEFLIGIFDNIELAQVARVSHQQNNDREYDYCIETWVIEGRMEEEDG